MNNSLVWWRLSPSAAGAGPRRSSALRACRAERQFSLLLTMIMMMAIQPLLFLLLLVPPSALALSSAAPPLDLYVAPNGLDNSTCADAQYPCQTLSWAAAIYNSVANSSVPSLGPPATTIHLRAGVYGICANQQPAVILRGPADATPSASVTLVASDGPGTAVLSCYGVELLSQPFISVVNVANFTLSGLSVLGLRSSVSGGFLSVLNSTITLSQFTLRDSLVIPNSALLNLYVLGPVLFQDSVATVTDSLFVNNTMLTSEGMNAVEPSGGAITAYESPLTLLRCRFENNRVGPPVNQPLGMYAISTAGAVLTASLRGTVHLLVDSCTFRGNTARLVGGALAVVAALTSYGGGPAPPPPPSEFGVHVQLRRTLFAGNAVGAVPVLVGVMTAATGGAIAVKVSMRLTPQALEFPLNVTLDSCQFVNNSVQATSPNPLGSLLGGAVSMQLEFIAAANMSRPGLFQTELNLFQCTFRGNYAAGPATVLGGAVGMLLTGHPAYPMRIENRVLAASCLFADNAIVGTPPSLLPTFGSNPLQAWGGALGINWVFDAQSVFNVSGLYQAQITQCSFTGNSVVVPPQIAVPLGSSPTAELIAGGGAVFAALTMRQLDVTLTDWQFLAPLSQLAVVSVQDSVLENNTVAAYSPALAVGGAVHFLNAVRESLARAGFGDFGLQAAVVRCQLVGNSVTAWGAQVAANGGGAVAVMTDVTPVLGTIRNVSTSVELEDCQLRDNWVRLLNSSSSGGGTVMAGAVLTRLVAAGLAGLARLTHSTVLRQCVLAHNGVVTDSVLSATSGGAVAADLLLSAIGAPIQGAQLRLIHERSRFEGNLLLGPRAAAPLTTYRLAGASPSVCLGAAVALHTLGLSQTNSGSSTGSAASLLAQSGVTLADHYSDFRDNAAVCTNAAGGALAVLTAGVPIVGPPPAVAVSGSSFVNNSIVTGASPLSPTPLVFSGAAIFVSYDLSLVQQLQQQQQLQQAQQQQQQQSSSTTLASYPSALLLLDGCVVHNNTVFLPPAESLYLSTVPSYANALISVAGAVCDVGSEISRSDFRGNAVLTADGRPVLAPSFPASGAPGGLPAPASSAFVSGAIASTSTLITDCWLQGNLGAHAGALACTAPGPCSSVNSTYMNNTGGDAGAIVVQNSVSFSSSGDLYARNSGLRVGAVHVPQLPPVLPFTVSGLAGCTISNTRFVGNLALDSQLAVGALAFGDVRLQAAAATGVQTSGVLLTSVDFVENGGARAGALLVSAYCSVQGIQVAFIANGVPFASVDPLSESVLSNGVVGAGAIALLALSRYGDVLAGSSLACTNCSFLNNSGINGGAVYAGTTEVQFTNTQFLNNTARNGGVVFAPSAGLLACTQCDLIGNHASLGAVVAVVLRPIQLNLVYSVLALNVADYGGAAYMDAQSVRMLLLGSIIANNTANVAGGLVYYRQFSVSIINLQSTLVGNTAPSGPLQAGIPVALNLTAAAVPCAGMAVPPPSPPAALAFDTNGTGPPLPPALQVSSGCSLQLNITSYDRFGNLVLGTPVTVPPGTLLFEVLQGCVGQPSVSVYFGSPVTAQAAVSGPVGSAFAVSVRLTDSVYPLQSNILNGSVVACGPGFLAPMPATAAANRTTGPLAPSSCASCLPCQPGYYNLNGNGQCLPCNPQHEQCAGGYLFATAGSWIAVDAVTRAPTLLQCREAMCMSACNASSPTECIPGAGAPVRCYQNASLGGTVVGTYCEAVNRCSPGRTGFLCGQCSEQYSLWNGRCIECSAPQPAYLVLIALGMYAYVLLVLVGMSSTLGSPYMRSLLFLIQVSTTFVLSTNPLRPFTEFGNLHAVSTTGCPYMRDYLRSLLDRYMAVLIMVVAFGVTLAGAHVGVRLWRKQWPDRSRWLLRPLLALVLALYSPLTAAAVDTLNCRQVLPGITVLVEQPAFVCSGLVYGRLRIVALVVLVLCTVGVPVVLLASLLLVVRPHADRPWCRYWLGLLFDCYRPDRYWWDVVVLLQRLAASLVRVMVDSVAGQHFTLASLCLLYTGMQLLLTPYNHVLANVVSVAVLGCQLFAALTEASILDLLADQADNAVVISAVVLGIVLAVLGFVLEHWRRGPCAKPVAGGADTKQAEHWGGARTGSAPVPLRKVSGMSLREALLAEDERADAVELEQPFAADQRVPGRAHSSYLPFSEL